jgi:hypothetical protein
LNTSSAVNPSDVTWLPATCDAVDLTAYSRKSFINSTTVTSISAAAPASAMAERAIA